MKKKLILFTFILISNFASSQILRIYRINEIRKFLSCNLNLYRDGRYGITLSDHTEENPHVLIVSFGKYSIKKKMITLSDEYNGFKLVFIYSKNHLIPVHTFSWINNQKFIYNNSGIENENIFFKDKYSTLKESRIIFNEKNKQINLLLYKEYKNQKYFCFSITKNHTYKFIYKDILLSVGTWRRVGNELILNDSTLNYPFYVLIGKEYLLCKIIPTNFEEIKFNIRIMSPSWQN